MEMWPGSVEGGPEKKTNWCFKENSTDLGRWGGGGAESGSQLFSYWI